MAYFDFLPGIIAAVDSKFSKEDKAATHAAGHVFLESGVTLVITDDGAAASSGVARQGISGPGQGQNA